MIISKISLAWFFSTQSPLEWFPENYKLFLKTRFLKCAFNNNLISYLVGFRQGDKIPEAFIVSIPPVGNVEHTCLASCKRQWLLPGLRVDISFRLTITIIFWPALNIE